MYKYLFFLFLLLPLTSVEAHERIFPEPTSSEDYIVIKDIDALSSYYGTLYQYPHTYLFEVTDSEVLTVNVAVPDDVDIENNRSLIVVRQEVRGVSEITRVRAKDAEWKSLYQVVDAESYRAGNIRTQKLEKGIYLLEVSTPDNIGPYVLTVGTKNSWSVFGYFRTLHDVYIVQKFLDKSGLGVIQSPLVYVPFGFILLSILVFHIRRKYYA